MAGAEERLAELEAVHIETLHELGQVKAELKKVMENKKESAVQG